MMRSPSPLPDNVRQKSGERINDATIDLLGLASVARKAHWNVRGPLFGQLHALFGELYDLATSHADKLAEHVAMLGLVVRGDHVEIAKDAEAEPIDEETDGLELAELIFDRTQTTIAELAKAQKDVQKLGNEDGFQLLLDTTIALSKLGWQLGSYLEGPETERGERKSKLPEEGSS
jgi:starvation-inducible DNA-binding protein